MHPMPDADKNSIRLGRRIREVRHERGWSLAQLAALTGKDKGNLSRIENGRLPNIPLPTLRSIAKALRVSPGSLLNDRAA